MRAHFVRARVKIHVYADGSHAVFHGPRCIGRYDENGTIRDAKKRCLSLLGGEPVDGMDKPPACPPAHRRTKAEEADI